MSSAECILSAGRKVGFGQKFVTAIREASSLEVLGKETGERLYCWWAIAIDEHVLLDEYLIIALGHIWGINHATDFPEMVY